MLFEDSSSHYDVLELTPDATPQEIRSSYLRLKSAYSKNNVAVYTLVSKDEMEDMLRKIEEAYFILSNPEKRKEYDQHFGLLTFDSVETNSMQNTPLDNKVVSIDRVPPMDASASSDDLLNSPSTDFSAASAKNTRFFTSSEAPLPVFGSNAAVPKADAKPALDLRPVFETPTLQQALLEEIEKESDWSGVFLKKIREALHISTEEMSEFTKISRTYLNAIESEDFVKLPAAVYLRGFLVQIAKKLRLPHEKVAAAYIARFKKAFAEKP